VALFFGLTVLLQQMANRSYLKSQKLKATEADRQRITLLEAENASLKKDKAALEQRVKMLKEVIQKNRGNLLICVMRFSFLVIRVLTSFLLWPQTVQRSTRRSWRNFEWQLRLWLSVFYRRVLRGVSRGECL
jgi:hypothetical protein